MDDQNVFPGGIVLCGWLLRLVTALLMGDSPMRRFSQRDTCLLDTSPFAATALFPSVRNKLRHPDLFPLLTLVDEADEVKSHQTFALAARNTTTLPTLLCPVVPSPQTKQHRVNGRNPQPAQVASVSYDDRHTTQRLLDSRGKRSSSTMVFCIILLQVTMASRLDSTVCPVCRVGQR